MSEEDGNELEVLDIMESLKD